MSDDRREIESVENAVEIAASKRTSIAEKMDSLFYLKSLGTREAAQCVQKCLTKASVLQDHEAAYVLGQMKQPNSVEFLFEVAGDETINDIVRHEAIEALGNYEDSGLIARLEVFLDSASDVVRESAMLAINKLSTPREAAEMVGTYGTRDPAFPHRGTFDEAVEKFKNGTLTQKYEAIFYLRDLNTKKAVDVLAAGFDDPSELLRHEVAYVFGQMVNEHSCDVLIKVLNSPNEKEIVRHEAAEALGNIGTLQCIEALSAYIDSDVQILRESALVGLGIYDKNGK